MTGMRNDIGVAAGRTYLERGDLVTVLAEVDPEGQTRRVLIRRSDGSTAVRPILGLRRTSPITCQCGCGLRPANAGAEYVRGHRPTVADASTGQMQPCSVPQRSEHRASH